MLNVRGMIILRLKEFEIFTRLKKEKLTHSQTETNLVKLSTKNNEKVKFYCHKRPGFWTSLEKKQL